MSLFWFDISGNKSCSPSCLLLKLFTESFGPLSDRYLMKVWQTENVVLMNYSSSRQDSVLSSSCYQVAPFTDAPVTHSAVQTFVKKYFGSIRFDVKSLKSICKSIITWYVWIPHVDNDAASAFNNTEKVCILKRLCWMTVNTSSDFLTVGSTKQQVWRRPHGIWKIRLALSTVLLNYNNN